jgi:hypothetical protein
MDQLATSAVSVCTTHHEAFTTTSNSNHRLDVDEKIQEHPSVHFLSEK